MKVISASWGRQFADVYLNNNIIFYQKLQQHLPSTEEVLKLLMDANMTIK